MTEKESLEKYLDYLRNIESLKQQDIEKLIFFLEKEIFKNSYSINGLISNYIKLLRNIELRKDLSEEELSCIEQLKQGNVVVIEYPENKKDKNVLNLINKEKKKKS